jgi:hypothetical protein
MFLALAREACQVPLAACLPFRVLLVAFHRFQVLQADCLLFQVLLVSNRSILNTLVDAAEFILGGVFFC